MNLPPFPVDDATLELLSDALHPSPEVERTSLWDFLSMMSQLGGSDIQAEVEDGILRDAQYTDQDVILALIGEIKRVKQAIVSDSSVVAVAHWLDMYVPRGQTHLDLARQIIAIVQEELWPTR